MPQGIRLITKHHIQAFFLHLLEVMDIATGGSDSRHQLRRNEGNRKAKAKDSGDCPEELIKNTAMMSAFSCYSALSEKRCRVK